MNFLVVDDSATMRKIVSLALAGAGHSYKEAGNGKEALEAIRGARPDCVLLDINMPEMNGIEFLRARSGDPAMKGIPVIVLTTQDEEELRKEALGLGANGFLPKPFQKEALLEAVRSATAK